MLTGNRVRTPSTIRTYDRISSTLLRRAQRMKQQGEMGDIDDAARQLAFAYLDAEPVVTAATARLYRAATLHWLRKNPCATTDDALDLLEPPDGEAQLYRAETLADRRQALTQLRGPQQKAKWLEQDDWDKLLAAVREHENPWAPLAHDWLVAGICTGLRPVEWRNARWEPPRLTVKNAKATNGRAHGPFRTLDLRRSPPAHRDVVERLSEHLSSLGDAEYQRAYDGVRNLIRRISRALFPRRKTFPTLYTARHVFASNAKATMPAAWVAALMGHAGTATAARHYAPAHRRAATKAPAIEPVKADVDAVLRRVERARQLIQQRSIASR